MEIKKSLHQISIPLFGRSLLLLVRSDKSGGVVVVRPCTASSDSSGGVAVQRLAAALLVLDEVSGEVGHLKK